MKQYLLCLLLLAFASAASAQSTAFTYQGHLMDGGASANGNYDIQFTLKNALSGGSTVGTPQSASPVTAVNGIFTVTLDFGSAPFDGTDRWVELGVRPAGSMAAYTVLAPRQRLTATPYALRALNATNLTGTVTAGNIANGTITGAMLTDGAVGSAQLGSDLSLNGSTTLVTTTGGSIVVNESQLIPQIEMQGGTVPGILRFRNGLEIWPNSAATTAGSLDVRDNSGTPTIQLAGADGTLTAVAFVGNGAGLTNIPASAVATPPPGMVLIPAGAFTMGDSLDGLSDATPTVSTTVSAFYMDVNEVTLSQWQSVYYWAKDNGYTDLPAGSGKGPNHPVQMVSWYAVVKWCNARSAQAGKTPVYYTNDAQTTIYKTGDVTVTNAQVKWTTNGYRLPTEAEWEKAARGRLPGKRFPWGNTITQNLANYYGNTSLSYDLGPNGYNAIGSVGGTSPATSPVASFAANGYGLNDMAGNVFEWCWDRYGTQYAGGTDPKGAATGFSRVIRGGGWNGDASNARCADRFDYDPTVAINGFGFRAVLSPGQP